MELSYWLSRWNKDKTGFHASEVNQHLIAHWHKTGAPAHSTVFVPLCGRSLDMLWLAEKGHKVIGVEVSEKACELFFRDASMDYKVIKHQTFKIFQSKTVDIWCGDFFKLKDGDFPPFTAVYDRAALVAMPPEKRKPYSQKIVELSGNNLIMLLVSFTYPQDVMPGPPFSVDAREIKYLFGTDNTVMELSSLDILEISEKYQKKGLTGFQEISYLVKKKHHKKR